MGIGKPKYFFLLLLVVIVVLALVALSGCGKVKDKAEDVAEIALDAVEKGAEIAGEATANWLGTMAGNVGKDFNETIAKRFAYLEISIDKVDIIEQEEAEGEIDEADGIELDEPEGESDDDGIIIYSIDLTLNNTAPDTEKMYIDTVLGDHYLVACDQNDYTYSLAAYNSYNRSDNLIKPGKSRLTVYTELSDQDELSYLLFIGNKINLP